MKKLVCVILGMAVLASIVFVAGCGGGGGGLGAIIAGALIISLAASGPAGAAAFAASVREPPRSAIYRDTVSSKYYVRITPTGKTPVATTTVTVSTNGKTLSFGNLSVETSTDGHYLVEFFPANYTASTSPIFKHWFRKTGGDTYTDRYTNNPITVTETATALAYDEWKKKAPTKTYTDFTGQNPNVATLTTAITTQMNTIGTFTNDMATFTWNAAVSSEAVAVASATSVPTTESSSQTTLTSTNLIGTWKLIQASKAYNDPTLWSVEPSPTGNVDTQIFNSNSTGHSTGYPMNSGSNTWVMADPAVSDSDFTWTLSGDQLTLNLQNPSSVHSYTASLTSEGYLKKIQSTQYGNWIWIMRKN